MDISNKYAIYVGTARGILACTHCTKDEKFKYELSENPAEITAMEWGPTENDIVIGYKDGCVRFYDTVTDKFYKTLSDDGAPIVGIGCTDEFTITGTFNGSISLWKSKKKRSKTFSLNLPEDATLNNMVFNPSRNVIGTGGEKNDFKLWDINTQKCIFAAKSLGHDFLSLPIPTSVRGICFFPSESNLSACATKEGHVLLYDDRVQRRPVVKLIETKASYTTISTAFREKQCLTGTTRGYMQLIDLKSPGRCLKTFKSFTGSVTAIQCDPIEPFVVSTCLDRFLRVHNLDTKELVHKEYMKQNLTKVLIKPYVKEEPETVNVHQAEGDDEYEQLFENMETVSETPSKRGKKKGKKVVEESFEEDCETPVKRKKKTKADVRVVLDDSVTKNKKGKVKSTTVINPFGSGKKKKLEDFNK